MLRTAVSHVVFAVVMLALVAGIAPDLDLDLAGLFFDPARQSFPAASDPGIAWMRDHGLVSVIACLGCLAAMLTVKLLLPSRPLVIPGRAAIFLAATMALGPGLLVNGVLKEHWGRPRPVEVTQFGGHERFVAWWNNSGTCTSNCSFVSGEAATAAWMFAPALLLPAPWRPAALGAAAVFTVTMGILRMAFGGHFFTDVVFGIMVTLGVTWLLYGLIFRWTRTALDDDAIDRAVGAFARVTRHLAVSLARRLGEAWRRPRPSTDAPAA